MNIIFIPNNHFKSEIQPTLLKILWIVNTIKANTHIGVRGEAEGQGLILTCCIKTHCNVGKSRRDFWKFLQWSKRYLFPSHFYCNTTVKPISKGLGCLSLTSYIVELCSTVRQRSKWTGNTLVETNFTMLRLSHAFALLKLFPKYSSIMCTKFA